MEANGTRGPLATHRSRASPPRRCDPANRVDARCCGEFLSRRQATTCRTAGYRNGSPIPACRESPGNLQRDSSSASSLSPLLLLSTSLEVYYYSARLCRNFKSKIRTERDSERPFDLEYATSVPRNDANFGIGTLVIWNASSLHYKSARERRRRALMANAGMRGRPVARLVLSAQERSYLERQVGRHRVARSLSERCRVILRCADGLQSKDVAAELGLHEHTVGKWRADF